MSFSRSNLVLAERMCLKSILWGAMLASFARAQASSTAMCPDGQCKDLIEQELWWSCKHRDSEGVLGCTWVLLDLTFQIQAESDNSNGSAAVTITSHLKPGDYGSSYTSSCRKMLAENPGCSFRNMVEPTFSVDTVGIVFAVLISFFEAASILQATLITQQGNCEGVSSFAPLNAHRRIEGM